MKQLVRSILLSTTCLLIAGQVVFADESQKLKQIQDQLNQAQKELTKQQQEKNKVQLDLKNVQQQISAEEKALGKINKEQAEYWQELQKLQANNRQLQTKVNNNKAQISRLLNTHYKNKQPDALVLLIKNSEPNQKGRQLQYVRYLQQANQKAIAQLVEQQQQIDKQQQQISKQLEKIKQLQEEQKKIVGKLQDKNSIALKESQQLDQNINQQTSKITSLKQDEKRLNQVIADIARKSAERARQQAIAEAKAKAKAKEDAQKRALALAEKKKQQQAAQDKANKNKQAQTNTTTKSPTDKTPTKEIPQSTLTKEDLALSPTDGKAIEVTALNDEQFSRMQGKMRLPLSGKIIGRFGQSKSSGGVWKGIYIAGQGSVAAVANGQVAFSGNLPGYGSTVIIDHGGQYLTVYTGLSSIFASNGQKIKAQQSIGSSGQLPNEEKGVYFEIRYRGQAMNPLSWVR